MANIAPFTEMNDKFMAEANKQSLAHNNDAIDSFCFEQDGKTFQEIYDLFKREKLLGELKSAVSDASTTRGQFGAAKGTMESMAAMERDLRYRHQSRLDGYRRASLQKLYIKGAAEYYGFRMTEINK